MGKVVLSLESLAEKIVKAREGMAMALRRSLSYAKEIGEHLLMAREMTDYAEFVEWCGSIRISRDHGEELHADCPAMG